jgi:hypothetical protein
LQVFAPEFVLVRFIAIASNQHASSRFMFWQAAWDIFKQSPFIGFGTGAFETKFVQVQHMYVQSKYVHSHYLQTALETGIIGIFLYITLIFYTIRILVKKYRSSSEDKRLTIAITSAFVMILGHSAVDFEMSFEWYLIFVWMLFAIVAATMDEKPKLKLIPDKLVMSIALLLPLFMLLLCMGNVIAEGALKNIGSNKNISAVELTKKVKNSVLIDPLHVANYKSDYIQILTGNELPPDYKILAEKYADDLDTYAARSIRIAEILVHYYVSSEEYEKALSCATKIPKIRALDHNSWDIALEICAIIYESDDKKLQEEAIKAIDEISLYLDEVLVTAEEPIYLSDKSKETLALPLIQSRR